MLSRPIPLVVASAAAFLLAAVLWIAPPGGATGNAGAITVGSATVDNTGDEASVVVSAAAPGGSGIGAWEIDISYDPAALGTPDCTPIQGGGGCVVDPGGTPGIIRLAGFTGLPAGLTGTVELANITADAGVAAGECSDLTVSTVGFFADQDGLDIANPALGAGEICVAAASTATPAGTPAAGVDRKWGDTDCNNKVLPRDGQALLRKLLSQPPLSTTPPCLAINQAIIVAGHSGTRWADWDCSGTVLPRDGQALLRKLLSQTPLSQTGDCPGIGDLVQVSD